MLRSYPIGGKSVASEKSALRVLAAIQSLSPDQEGVGATDLDRLPSDLFWSDLGRTPFKDALLGYSRLPRTERSLAVELLPARFRDRAVDLREFIQRAQLGISHLAPLLFPTRPLSPPEVTECASKCAAELRLLAKYVRALRGTWVRTPDESDSETTTDRGVPPRGALPADDGPPSTPSSSTHRTDPDAFEIGLGRRRRHPKIALTSFLVEESASARAAAGKPDLSSGRYKQLVRMANAILKCPCRPDYVIFPELSIPRRWLRGLASKFLSSGISLIAGIEYELTTWHEARCQRSTALSY